MSAKLGLFSVRELQTIWDYLESKDVFNLAQISFEVIDSCKYAFALIT